jgi:amino acid transporter
MWNYMGWDNASTIATEVERPQRTYPRAMLWAVVIVCITYILPFAAMWMTGLPASAWETGAWADVAQLMGGPVLRIALVAGGMMSGFGMFNALVMSYSRLPMAMAEDRMLPRFVARRNSRGVPWVSVILCGLAWALALKLPFEKLITIDIVLYGTSLMLEFVALVVLRLREPALARPFKTGNLACACLLGLGPAALMIYALYASRTDEVKLGGESISALLFSLIVALLGPLLYRFATPRAGRNREIPAPATE